MDIKDILKKQDLLPDYINLYNPSLKTDFKWKNVSIPKREIGKVPKGYLSVVKKRMSDILVNERNIGYVSKEKRKLLYKELEVEL